MEQSAFAITTSHRSRLRVSAYISIELGLATLVLASHQALAAAAAPCEPPPPYAQVKLGYSSSAAESLGSTGSVALDQTHASFDTGPSSSRVRTRVSHDYSIFDIGLGPASTPPSGNGHLHRLALDADFSSALNNGWQLRLQPALAVSSNQLRSPKRIQAQGLQLNAALLRYIATGPDSGWTAGLCADQRFGDYRIYPGVSWQRSTNDWFVQLGWPDSRLTKQLTPTLHTSLQVSPSGNRWHVLGQEQYHWFSHEAWQARWAVEWRPFATLGLELSTSLLFENRVSFKTEDGTLLQGKTDTPQQWGLSLIWYLE